MDEGAKHVWYFYLLECQTPNHYYVGITQHLDARLAAHEKNAFTKTGTRATAVHGLRSWWLLGQEETTNSQAMWLEGLLVGWIEHLLPGAHVMGGAKSKPCCQPGLHKI